ncbi:MAG TPA: hypothetical protein VGM51_03975, partial [Armatimonadota bacterium]
MTLHVVVPPDDTEAGLQVSALICTGAAVTVTDAVLEVPFAVAVTVTAVLVETVPAVAVNVPVLPPATTVTEAGTVRAVLSSESVTT